MCREPFGFGDFPAKCQDVRDGAVPETQKREKPQHCEENKRDEQRGNRRKFSDGKNRVLTFC